MDKTEYLKLLDNAYKDLPEVLYKKARFEIPEVKGRLVKSRTIVSNFRDIAKHFSREIDHFSKFMLKELGVRGEVDSRGELILHSRFQPNMLNKSINRYFTSYVECSHCKSPDTVFEENDTILKCNACGHQAKISRL